MQEKSQCTKEERRSEEERRKINQKKRKEKSNNNSNDDDKRREFSARTVGRKNNNTQNFSESLPTYTKFTKHTICDDTIRYDVYMYIISSNFPSARHNIHTQ